MRQQLLLILPFLWGCDNQIQKDNSIETKDKIAKETNSANLESDSKDKEWNYLEVKRSYVDSLILDTCSAQNIEIIDLYPILDSIASDKYENLILVDLLKTKKFKATDWGRGNWMEGPRIVSYTMSNENCECQVDKLYYSTEHAGKYKVTERLKCRKAPR